MDGRLRNWFVFTLLLLNIARGEIWQDVTISQNGHFANADHCAYGRTVRKLKSFLQMCLA